MTSFINDSPHVIQNKKKQQILEQYKLHELSLTLGTEIIDISNLSTCGGGDEVEHFPAIIPTVVGEIINSVQAIDADINLFPLRLVKLFLHHHSKYLTMIKDTNFGLANLV